MTKPKKTPTTTKIDPDLQAYDNFMESYRCPSPQDNQDYCKFIEKHGQQFGPPKESYSGKPNCCYLNAACWALGLRLFRDEICYGKGLGSVTYVEGVTHAWVVDANGNTIEVTWGSSLTGRFLTQHHDYFGVPYSTEWLHQHVRKYRFVYKMRKQCFWFPGLQLKVFAPLGSQALEAGVIKEQLNQTPLETVLDKRQRNRDTIALAKSKKPASQTTSKK